MLKMSKLRHGVINNCLQNHMVKKERDGNLNLKPLTTRPHHLWHSQVIQNLMGHDKGLYSKLYFKVNRKPLKMKSKEVRRDREDMETSAKRLLGPVWQLMQNEIVTEFTATRRK